MNQKEIIIPCGTSVVIRCEAPKNNKKIPINTNVLPIPSEGNSNTGSPVREGNMNPNLVSSTEGTNNTKKTNIVPPTISEIPGVIPLNPTGPSTPNEIPNTNKSSNNIKNKNTKNKNKNKNKNKKNNTTKKNAGNSNSVPVEAITMRSSKRKRNNNNTSRNNTTKRSRNTTNNMS